MANNQFITPAKAARGLGSAKSGTSDHIRQHASGAGYDGAVEWAGKPWNAILLILTAGAAFFHMRIGMQIVIEDYIGKTGTRSALLILNSFACIALFATVALSVLKLWIGADA